MFFISGKIKDSTHNLFDELSALTKLEDICQGRQGAIIVEPREDMSIPLVRTTTIYRTPVQKFEKLHHQIIQKIQKESGIDKLSFNNAMVEIYDSRYRKMKYHTDQALDLEDDSYICLFTCYDKESIEISNLRNFQIRDKETLDISEIYLENNSFVIFSTDFNQKHMHKIILESTKSKEKWLGITFRLSKTFIKFNNKVAYLNPTSLLLLATDEERKLFYQYKKEENQQIGYEYPKEIEYTISISDLLFPTFLN